MMLGEEYPRQIASLELSREMEEAKTTSQDVEGSLLLALIKTKGTNHVGFW